MATTRPPKSPPSPNHQAALLRDLRREVTRARDRAAELLDEIARLRAEHAEQADHIAGLEAQQAAALEVARSVGQGLGDLPGVLQQLATLAGRLCDADGFSTFLERGN